MTKCKELIDLIIYDRVKQVLPDNVVKHALALEVGSLNLDELLSAIDVYMARHFVTEQPRRVNTSSVTHGENFGANGAKDYRVDNV